MNLTTIAAANVGQDSSNKGQTKRHPWRENIEALIMAIILALLLKAFIVEAYKIPTGSMQPTLMGLGGAPGSQSVQIFDRILVDKFSPKLRSPKRFEVAVFKYPLDRSKNFVKRICGMPDEEFAIRNGDLWTRADSNAEWRILRRPDSVMQDIWKNLDLVSTEESNWALVSGGDGWKLRGQSIEATGPGRLRYGKLDSPILDRYFHGYPDFLRRQLSPMHPRETNNRVGDLRLECRARAAETLQSLSIEIVEGAARYRFLIPGPAASGEAKPSVLVDGSSADSMGAKEPALTQTAKPWSLPAGKRVRLAVQNLDDQLRLELDGEVVAEIEVAPQSLADARVYMEVLGQGVMLDEIQLQRDIFYTSGSKQSEFVIPPGHYFMLGDNTQDSSDSREWTFWRYQVLDPGAASASDGSLPKTLRGNFRQGQNPYSDATATWMDDEWGERHILAVEGTPRFNPLPKGVEATPVRSLAPEAAPFVEESLITGRAIAVFWPINPLKGLYRFKWIH